jgi:hypothetical protein
MKAVKTVPLRLQTANFGSKNSRRIWKGIYGANKFWRQKAGMFLFYGNAKSREILIDS